MHVIIETSLLSMKHASRQLNIPVIQCNMHIIGERCIIPIKHTCHQQILFNKTCTLSMKHDRMSSMKHACHQRNMQAIY